MSSYMPEPSMPPLRRPDGVGKQKQNDVLIGVVVSMWDNIVGPQCIYLWTEEMTSVFFPSNLPLILTRLIKYVADHTVDHHEMVDGNLVSHVTQKGGLCIVPDLNLVYMSLSIRVPTDIGETDKPGTTVLHSVAVLANLQYLHHIILMRPLIMKWLTEFSPKIGVLICKNKLQMSLINSWCAELCKTMAAVQTCWSQNALTDTTARANDYTIKQMNAISTNKSNTVTFVAKGTKESEYDYLPPAAGKGNLETMVTSHLSTGCCTLIVGPDAQEINHVIRFLLCFSKAEEGYCSRYVLPILPDTFMKGLYVQGLIAGEIGEKSISVNFNQLSSNRYPFTQIELNSKQNIVRQMPVFPHQAQREMTLIHELTALWNSTSYVPVHTDVAYQAVNESAGFVTKLFEDLQVIPPERRYARLLLFRKMLHARAVELITYLQSIQFQQRKEKTVLLKHLAETLCLDEREFLIVQVTAEKIRPGVLNLCRW